MARTDNKVRITKRICDAAPPENGRRLIWDSELQGFCLRVTAAGSKTFVVYYRAGGGRSGSPKLFTLGKYGPQFLPEKARERARGVLADIVKGRDPQVDRNEKRAELTVSELCDLYLEDGCKTKKASTLVTDRSRINRHIKPLLGKRRLSTVKHTDIVRFQNDIASGEKISLVERTGKLRGKSVVTGGKGTASRTVGLLGGIFTYAVKRELLATNPVRGVERFKDKKSLRYLSPAEIGRLGEALRSLEQEGAHPAGVAIIRLLALTGARKSEIAGLQWSEVDFERGLLCLADSKTGAKTLILSPAAASILASQSRQLTSPYVFPATTGDGFFVGADKLWLRVRILAELPDVRIHDLRHSFASFGAAGGFGLPVIGALLGHKDSKTTMRYAHLADDPLRRASTRIESEILAALNIGTAHNV